MEIILDTDKKTITVPWNYTNKLDEINRMVKEYGGPDAKIKTFSGYLNECWEEAMALLQYAHTPYMDKLASLGRTGMLKTVQYGRVSDGCQGKL